MIANAARDDTAALMDSVMTEVVKGDSMDIISLMRKNKQDYIVRNTKNWVDTMSCVDLENLLRRRDSDQEVLYLLRIFTC